MKKLLLFLLCFILFISRVDASRSSAYEYILMDEVTGRVLEGKNIHNPKLIASITKIMSCILAIESGKIDDIVIVDDTISSSYGSGIYISVGEEISLRDLLYGLMLRSGNDAALMIAKYVSGNVMDFVKLMNSKAKEIGMKNTIFVNPSGLDNNKNGNYSTAYDMALLTRYAMQNGIYRSIVKTKSYTVKTNLKTYVWKNKNKLLNYDYITGGKTGYTELAKRTLVSTGSKNGMNFIVVTIRDSDDWNTHKSLYEDVFKKYKNYLVLDKNIYQVKEDRYDNLYIKDNIYIPLTKEESKNLKLNINLEDKDRYKNGDIVGNNEILLYDKKIYSVPIYVNKSDKNRKNSKNIFQKIKEWFS